MQLLVVDLSNRTHCVSVSPSHQGPLSLLHLRKILDAQGGLDFPPLSPSICFSLGGRLLLDHTILTTTSFQLNELPPLRVVGKICGGKGGFGALLRGASTRVGQKKTSNFGACRDLNGRRIRHVDDEKSLADWEVEEHKLDAKQLREEYRKIKKGEKTETRMCKFGDACKYRDRCRFHHEIDDREAAERAKAESISGKLIGMDRPDEVVDQREIVMSAVEQGLLKMKEQRMQKKRKARPASDDHDDSDHTSEKESSSFSSSSSVSLSLNGNDSASPSSASPNSPPIDSVSPSKKQKLELGLPVDFPLLESKDSSSAAAASTAGLSSSSLSSPSGTSLAASSSSLSSVSSSSLAASVAFASSPFPPADLSKYATAKDLEELGLEHLKCELTRLGLKCGGTLQQRAERLFTLKTTPLEKVDPKLLAKK